MIESFLLSAILTTAQAKMPTVAASVVSITDGDTFKALIGGNQTTIRLACIDAPEKRQPYGKESTEQLKILLPIGAKIWIEPVAIDRYGRTVAKVINGKSVNLAMVQNGYAMIYSGYLKPCADIRMQLIQAESSAKYKRLGLWQQQQICEPWKFRQNRC